MVVVAAIKAATRLLVVVQACVFAMEAESAARSKDALKVQKDILDYVFHMVVDVGVNLPVAQKEPKVAPCFAKPTEEANAASFKTVTRVLRAALHSVKVTEVENDVPLTVVGFAPKVCTEAPSSVLLMGVGNDVLWMAAGKVQGVGQISAFVMEVENDVRSTDAARAHRVVQIFVRLMEVVNAASGDKRVPTWVTL